MVKKSPKRTSSPCKYYNECGGCSYLHSNYEYEKNIKTKYIEKLFNMNIDKSYFGSEYNYRNKATFHIDDGKIGYYKENSHELIEFDKCLLVDEAINDIYNEIKKYDLSNLNSVMIRTTTNEVMINIDGNIDYDKPNLNSKIDSLYINDKLKYGKEYITENINDIIYTIYPKSFFQVNKEAMINLYNIIKDYAGYGDKLLDLYSGTGTIGIYLKDNFNSIIGIEINKSSIDNANINKKLNNINNIKFIYGDAKKASEDKYDVIIVDPPRSGLSKDVIKYLNNSLSKIVYVSCNPITLKRDLDLLTNYSISKISIVNMFPKTKHIECCCVLKLKERLEE